MSFGATTLGTRTFVDTETGEIKTAYTTVTEAVDKDFHKIWLKNALNTLEIVGNKKTKVAYWVIEHMNKNNEFNFTYAEIEAQLGMSHQTVAVTMKKLIDGGFLQKKGHGKYVINPALIFRGSYGGRMNIMNEYVDTETAKKKAQTPQERLDELNSRIEIMLKNTERLQMQARHLAEKIANGSAQSDCAGGASEECLPE